MNFANVRAAQYRNGNGADDSNLSEIEQGIPQAAEKLLPLVYDELRRLARRTRRASAPITRCRRPR
jgi:hypothetical protein